MFSRILPLLPAAAVLLATNSVALALEPPPAEEPPAESAPAAPAYAAPGRIGGYLVLAGPVGNYGLSVAYQLLPMLELQAGAVTQSPEASQQSGTATAHASITAATPFVRGRLWPMRRHNVIAEAGFAAMYYNLQADGSDTFGNSIHYNRSSTVPLAFAGAGYGYRTDVGFRLAVLMGWMQYLGSAGGSTVSTTGAFSAQDRADMQKQFDTTTNRMTESRPYVELSAGWVF